MALTPTPAAMPIDFIPAMPVSLPGFATVGGEFAQFLGVTPGPASAPAVPTPDVARPNSGTISTQPGTVKLGSNLSLSIGSSADAPAQIGAIARAAAGPRDAAAADAPVIPPGKSGVERPIDAAPAPLPAGPDPTTADAWHVATANPVGSTPAPNQPSAKVVRPADLAPTGSAAETPLPSPAPSLPAKSSDQPADLARSADAPIAPRDADSGTPDREDPLDDIVAACTPPPDSSLPVPIASPLPLPARSTISVAGSTAMRKPAAGATLVVSVGPTADAQPDALPPSHAAKPDASPAEHGAASRDSSSRDAAADGAVPVAPSTAPAFVERAPVSFASHLRGAIHAHDAPAASPPPAPAAATAHAPAAAQQIAVSRHVAKDLATSEAMTIRMAPAELGRIEVRLDFGEARQVTAAVTADHAATVEILRRDADALQQSLSDAGFAPDGVDLRFDTRGGGADSGGGERNGTRRVPTPAFPAASGEEAPYPAPPTPGGRNLSGRIDLIA